MAAYQQRSESLKKIDNPKVSAFSTSDIPHLLFYMSSSWGADKLLKVKNFSWLAFLFWRLFVPATATMEGVLWVLCPLPSQPLKMFPPLCEVYFKYFVSVTYISFSILIRSPSNYRSISSNSLRLIVDVSPFSVWAPGVTEALLAPAFADVDGVLLFPDIF